MIQRTQNPTGTAATGLTYGIGYNSVTAYSGTSALTSDNTSSNLVTNMPARYIAPPTIGINIINSLEAGNANTPTFVGQEPNMLLTGQWRG
jgi:hypothetical protein